MFTDSSFKRLPAVRHIHIDPVWIVSWITHMFVSSSSNQSDHRSVPVHQQLTELRNKSLLTWLQLSVWADLLWFSSFLLLLPWWMTAAKNLSAAMKRTIRLANKKAPMGTALRTISTLLQSCDVTSLFCPPAVCSASAWRQKPSVSIWYQQRQLVRVKPPHHKHLYLSNSENEERRE